MNKVDWDDINYPLQEENKKIFHRTRIKTMRKLGRMTKRHYLKVIARARLRAAIGNILVSPGFIVAVGTVALFTLLILNG